MKKRKLRLTRKFCNITTRINLRGKRWSKIERELASLFENAKRHIYINGNLKNNRPVWLKITILGTEAIKGLLSRVTHAGAFDLKVLLLCLEKYR